VHWIVLINHDVGLGSALDSTDQSYVGLECALNSSNQSLCSIG